MNYIIISLVNAFSIKSVIGVVTPMHFEHLDGLGLPPYNQTHNKIYIQNGTSNNAMLMFFFCTLNFFQ
jgi:hypothetical protein